MSRYFLSVFKCDFVVCKNKVQKRSWCTSSEGVLGDPQGSGSPCTVAEHESITSPRMRIGNFDVAGIARSNFEPRVYDNKCVAISNEIATIDVMNVRDGVNVSVVALRGVRGERSKRLQVSTSTFLPHVCRAQHKVQGWPVAQRKQQDSKPKHA